MHISLSVLNKVQFDDDDDDDKIKMGEKPQFEKRMKHKESDGGLFLFVLKRGLCNYNGCVCGLKPDSSAAVTIIISSAGIFRGKVFLILM